MNRSASNNRYVLLDGMRGFASLGIMIFHLWLAPLKNFEGFVVLVDFFFVLSGFVLAPSLRNSDHTFRRKFLLSRAIRLYPMLIPVFIAIIVLEKVPAISRNLTQNTSITTNSMLGAILLLQIFLPSTIYLNVPLWSLSAEWFVNILAASVRLENRVKSVLAFGFLLEFSGLLINAKYDLLWGMNSYLVAIGRVLVGFYLGIFLREKLTQQSYQSTVPRIFAAFSLLITVYFLFSKSNIFIFLAAPASFFMIREGASLDVTRIPKSFARLCLYLGRISYGIYVWNDVIGKLNVPAYFIRHLSLQFTAMEKNTFDVLLTILATLLAVEFSIRIVEAPMQRFLRKYLKKFL